MFVSRSGPAESPTWSPFDNHKSPCAYHGTFHASYRRPQTTMSITIHLRTPCGESHAIDADGGVTIAKLHTVSSQAAGVEEGTFELRFEGEVLNRRDVEGSGL
eukprot:TRINITY_DN1290_c0_g3_i2.p3 TRINITY_DN1290_c0_g3~~TRINITY_DN1290_c0_g3_i2.p3  ORF type:complete len:103 (+),score=11.91 TRINITY_DN1290_c0_g3_i2:186-494(+)